MSDQFKQSRSSDSADAIAMVVEIIFGLFGVLGMGWLYAGNLPYAIAAFVGYGILVFIEVAIITATLGFAACVAIPLNIAIAVISGLRARDYVRNTGASGSLVVLLIGIIVGIAVICGGITLFFGGLAALLSAAGA